MPETRQVAQRANQSAVPAQEPLTDALASRCVARGMAHFAALLPGIAKKVIDGDVNADVLSEYSASSMLSAMCNSQSYAFKE